jgi:hypothetical protein
MGSRWHLTPEEKKEIARMTRAGIRQSEISRRLNIGRDSVSKAQRAMGLPTRLVIPEKQILRLFRRGWGGHRISKHLHVPANQVYAVAHRNKFRRKDGVGYPLSAQKRQQLMDDAALHVDHGNHLAEKRAVTPQTALRWIHRAVGPGRLRPGASKPPLSSAFPQKHHDKKIGERG